MTGFLFPSNQKAIKESRVRINNNVNIASITVVGWIHTGIIIAKNIRNIINKCIPYLPAVIDSESVDETVDGKIGVVGHAKIICDRYSRP